MTATRKGTLTLHAPKAKQKFVAVEDVLPAARLVHKAYLDARDELVAWGAEPENAARRYLRDWCEGLSKNKKIAALLRMSDLQSDQADYAREEAARRTKVETAATALVKTLGDPKLKAQLKSLGAAGLREGAALVQGLGESFTGGNHIERELPEGGGDGVLAWLLSAETAEKIEKGQDLFVKKPFELVEPVLDALAETAGTLVRLKQEKAVEYVATFVSTRFSIQITDLLTRETITLRGGMTSLTITSREFYVLKSEKLLDAEAVEKFSGKLAAVARLVAAVNFAAKLNVLVHDPSLKNAVESTGALAELLDTSETVGKTVMKFVRSGRQVGADGAPKALAAAGDAADVAAGAADVATGAADAAVASGAGKTFLKFLGEGIAKKATPLAVIAGVADTVTGSIDAYEDAGKGNYAAVFAHVGKTVGGCLIAAAGVIELVGAGADASVVASPVGIVLGILGLLVGAAAAVAEYFTAQSEVEVWANHCLYGKRYGEDDMAGWKDNLEKQIEALAEAVYQCKISGSLKQDVSEIVLEPSGITRASKMSCYVSAHTSTQDWPARQDLPLRDDASDCTLEFGKGEQSAAVKKITIRVSMPATGAKVNWESIHVNLTLDPDGDGSRPLKRNADIKQGKLAWVWAQL